MSKSIGVFNATTKAADRADLFNQIAAGVAVFNGQTIGTVGNDTMTISRKHATGAIIVICIILFPIGLLALLARPTETITVTAVETESGVTASLNGKGDDDLVDFLAELVRS